MTAEEPIVSATTEETTEEMPVEKASEKVETAQVEPESDIPDWLKGSETEVINEPATTQEIQETTKEPPLEKNPELTPLNTNMTADTVAMGAAT